MDGGRFDVGHFVLVAAAAPFVAFAVVVILPKLWRFPPERPTRPRRWTLRVAMRMFGFRYLHLNIVSVLLLELAGIAYFVQKLLSGTAARVAGVGVTVLGWAFVVSLLITVPVVFLNRPRFAVPPNLRNLRGPLELWWLSRRRPVSEIREDR